jgi:hypothetical protein
MNENLILKKNALRSENNLEHYDFLSKMPDEYLQFVNKNGAIEFVNIMEIFHDGVIYSLGNFYTLTEINDLLKEVEQFPSGFIPFCEGGANDYIGFKENDKKVYYLYNDRYTYETGIPIATNFNSFLDNIKPQQELESDRREITEVKLSDEFLSLLKNRKE